MKWLQAYLKDVAPSQVSSLTFAPSDEVWHLNLDQIESDTGNIVNKKVAPAFVAGSSTYVFDQTNVLYSKLRPYLNKVVCPNESGIATSELIPLKPNPLLLDRRYLTYYLRSRDFLNFARVAVAGVKMPRIIMHKFWNHKMPLPSITEQRRIVEVLDQADSLHKLRAEADEKTALILSTVFYKMFGDPATNPKKWKKKPFDFAFRDYTAKFPKIQRNAYQPTGQFPVVDQGKDRVAGFCDDEELVTSMEAPVIVFGDHTRIVKYVDFPFVAGADGTRILLANDGFEPTFLAMHLELHCIPNLGYSRHMREVRRLQFMAPPISLQEEFAKRAKSIHLLLEDQISCRLKLENMWQLLLCRAFTATLTARWREAHMKELLAEMEEQARYLNVEASA